MMKFVRWIIVAAAFITPNLLQASESIMVMEAYSGKILVAQNASEKRSVSNLVMMAMASVVTDWSTATGQDLSKVKMTVPDFISQVGGPNPMQLAPGDQISARDALISSMLGSDHLAALVLAEHVGRDLASRRGASGDPVAVFVEEMNRLAKALGMKSTRFANPHGLERKGVKQFSTAADMARMALYTMREPAVTFITRQTNRDVTVQGRNGNRSYKIPNSNRLVGTQGVSGVKTGLSQQAGGCVAVCSDKDPLVRARPDGSKGAMPRRVIVVVLNHSDRFGRASGLLNQGWATHEQWLAAGAPIGDQKRDFLKVPNLK